MKDKLDYKMLREAKASELVAGGVWYRKDDNNQFSTVVNDIDSISNLDAYRKELKRLSIEKRIYLRVDKPNYPLTTELDIYYKRKIELYESRPKKNNNS